MLFASRFLGGNIQSESLYGAEKKKLLLLLLLLLFTFTPQEKKRTDTKVIVSQMAELLLAIHPDMILEKYRKTQIHKYTNTQIHKYQFGLRTVQLLFTEE